MSACAGFGDIGALESVKTFENKCERRDPKNPIPLKQMARWVPPSTTPPPPPFPNIPDEKSG